MDKPPLKPFGRKLAEFVPLKPAEQKILDACREGTMASISNNRPEKADKDKIVRASFLRFLALGGDEYAPVHEKGVWLQGAWVEDDLNLESATLPYNLVLSQCYLNNIILISSKAHGLISFHGCHVNELKADRMICGNSVFLKQGFIATGKVSLDGAQIGYDFICYDAKFLNR